MSSSDSNNVPYQIVHDNATDSFTQPIGTTPPEEDHVLAYVLVPVGAVVLVALLAFIAVVIFRKNRMDRLRHHLMPMYSFDPNEDADWESELLEDQENSQHLALRIETPSPDNAPVYKFGPKRR